LPAAVPAAMPAASPSVVTASQPAPALDPVAKRPYRVIDDVSQGVLNMRTGASTSSPIVVAIPAGASDLGIGRCRPADDPGGRPWCEALWHGHAG
jgi:hypothetical protein